uniref:Small ribosomal subunit protein uS3c n=1 Tax=Ptisana novoguineensis TaxID=2764333 RepID=A0A7G7YI03_9MONI|nr:ribosomal protein S3 [Ptisana novoguineensis]QNH94123.1 ribosomal protein S3 [Ptisana novoguineensis]
MGQKINPLGFRVGVTQQHYSYWFAQPKNYSKFLEEDEKVRTCIEKYVQKQIKNSSNYGGIARIEIEGKTDLLQIEIYTGFPDLLVEENGLGIDKSRTNIEKLLKKKSQKIQITLKNVLQPYGEPRILAEHIALQLENRVAFRRTVKKAIELAKKTDIKGIKIQIAGRLNGNEIARVEWVREGRVPLQTIRAHINYCYYPAQTIYGVLGIKIWVFRDEE